ncbi:unnamed protein product [Closterium sp. Naga37s-1]|nr:unnamed protein product [Closterium sp. Naga37s-1]
MSVVARLAQLASARACSRFHPFRALLLPFLALLLAAPLLSLCAAERRNKPKSAIGTRLVILRNNTHGAKCLDGSQVRFHFLPLFHPPSSFPLPFSPTSPPAYYFRAGAGAGRRKWHVHLPTGGWCFTPQDCLDRANSFLGSSRFWARRLPAVVENGGAVMNVSFLAPTLAPISFLSSPLSCLFSHAIPSASSLLFAPSLPSTPQPTDHLLLFWPLRFCSLPTISGSSLYASLTLALLSVSPHKNLRTKRGMGAASQVLFSGSSAGGHAIIMHCDRLAAAFPRAKATCLADSGFFVDAKDRFGQNYWREKIQALTALHRINVPNCPAGESNAPGNPPGANGTILLWSPRPSSSSSFTSTAA